MRQLFGDYTKRRRWQIHCNPFKKRPLHHHHDAVPLFFLALTCRNPHPLQNPKHVPPSPRPLYIGTHIIKLNAHNTMVLAAKFGVVVLSTVVGFVDWRMADQVVGHED